MGNKKLKTMLHPPLQFAILNIESEKKELSSTERAFGRALGVLGASERIADGSRSSHPNRFRLCSGHALAAQRSPQGDNFDAALSCEQFATGNGAEHGEESKTEE